MTLAAAAATVRPRPRCCHDIRDDGQCLGRRGRCRIHGLCRHNCPPGRRDLDLGQRRRQCICLSNHVLGRCTRDLGRHGTTSVTEARAPLRTVSRSPQLRLLSWKIQVSRPRPRPSAAGVSNAAATVRRRSHSLHRCGDDLGRFGPDFGCCSDVLDHRGRARGGRGPDAGRGPPTDARAFPS